ncbi:MAG TPA: hypothetical protein VFP70_00100 [Burkholderiales bacterium]|nr:hypothetical protein [Burkholderiales bacterium]
MALTLKWSWVWALAAMAVLAGCGATVERGGRVDQFDKVIRAYETAIRWSDFDRAAGVAGLAPEQREAAQKLSRVKVISYEVISAEVSPDTVQVRQSVQIEYTVEGSVKLRRIVDRQGWRFDEAQGRWVLVSGLPDFLGQ